MTGQAPNVLSLAHCPSLAALASMQGSPAWPSPALLILLPPASRVNLQNTSYPLSSCKSSVLLPVYRIRSRLNCFYPLSFSLPVLWPPPVVGRLSPAGLSPGLASARRPSAPLDSYSSFLTELRDLVLGKVLPHLPFQKICTYFSHGSSHIFGNSFYISPLTQNESSLESEILSRLIFG